MKHLDLFSGIGGFALGLQWAGGFDTVAFCEIDKFCQKVLAKNFPGKPIFGDIHDLTVSALEQRGVTGIELVTAGFPCQPFSNAGNQRGIDDERFLWAQLFWVIWDIRPKYIILENVPNLLRVQKGLVWTGILYDLSSLGYAVEWGVIPASAVGAPHRRDRLFVIAYPDRLRACDSGQSGAIYHQNGNGTNEGQGREIVQHGTASLCANVSNATSIDGEWRSSQQCRGERSGETAPGGSSLSNTDSNRQRRRSSQHQKAKTETRRVFFAPERLSIPRGGEWDDLPASRVCRNSDGIPHRMDRLKSLGNAVVPQLIQMLGERLIAFDKELNETAQ